MNNFLILVLALLFTSTVAFKLTRHSDVLTEEEKSDILLAMSGGESTARLQHHHHQHHDIDLHPVALAALASNSEEIASAVETLEEAVEPVVEAAVETLEETVEEAVETAQMEIETEDMETETEARLQDDDEEELEHEDDEGCSFPTLDTTEDELMEIIECWMDAVHEAHDEAEDTDRIQRD
jgi:hypothetical protein